MPDQTPYPLGLRLQGLAVLVVGGGMVATRRVPALIAAGADVTIVSPELSPALRGLVDLGRAAWRPRAFAPSDVDGAWLVHAALNDPTAAAEVSAAAAERRVFCVRADDRNAATAWTPAVTRHGPVTVAVLGGGDPRRSMAVRDRIATGLADGQLDPSDGRSVPADDDRVADGGLPSGARPPASGEASGEHDAAAGAGRIGSVTLIGAGPGDPELITVKGRRLLAGAAAIGSCRRGSPGAWLSLR